MKIYGIKSIKSSTLQVAVYEELLQSILSGRIPPGQMITMESIAKMLGVSIMPVREAIRKLEAGDFVTIGKNRRISVKELSPHKLLELLEIRLLLEGYAADKASKIRSEESFNNLERLHQEVVNAVNAKDEDTYLRLNREFHNAIYREAKMPILEEIIDSLWKKVSPYLHILLRNKEAWKRGNFSKYHEGILEGMRRKDPEMVRNSLKKDLSEAAHLIKRTLEQERESEASE